jgi:hypothetical protein
MPFNIVLGDAIILNTKLQIRGRFFKKCTGHHGTNLSGNPKAKSAAWYNTEDNQMRTLNEDNQVHMLTPICLL